jgi:hypothetical protein
MLILLFMSFFSILGVTTVDDLLERIDDAIESAKIIVDNGQEKPPAKKTEAGQNAPAPGKDNTEKKPEEEEPIHIVYGDVHNIEDLLAAINDQPGHRKVVLEGAPGQSSTVSVQKSNNPPPPTASPEPADEKEDSSTTKKTTETPSSATKVEKTETPSSKTTAKTKETPSATTTEKKTETPSSTTKVEKTETPSSSTTTAKTTENPPPADEASSSEVDQIHVNIENIRSVDDLLDRIDEAVQKVPVVIDTKPRGLSLAIQYFIIYFAFVLFI